MIAQREVQPQKKFFRVHMPIASCILKRLHKSFEFRDHYSNSIYSIITTCPPTFPSTLHQSYAILNHTEAKQMTNLCHDQQKAWCRGGQFILQYNNNSLMKT